MIDLNLPTTTLIEGLLRESGWNIECPLEFDYLRCEQHGRSELYHLSLRCTGSADIPSQLLLKTQAVDTRECRFYQDTRGLGYPIPRCFAARPGTPSLILMEDLSASHSDISDWSAPLPEQATQDVLKAVAQFHAAGWDTRIASREETHLSSRAAYETFLGYLRHDLEIYVAGMGANLDPARHRLLHRVMACMPDLWDEVWEPRLADHKILPLIHGDLNPCNVLYPLQAEGQVVLVDWEAYHRGLPASDLTMLLGLHLCPEKDAVLPYLHAYHACLVSAGVRGYPFTDLLQDYQIALLYALFFPIKLYSQSGIQDQTMMDNAVLAVESFHEPDE